MKRVMQTQFYVGRLGDAAEQSLRDHIHRALYGPLTLMCSAFNLVAAT